MQRPATDNHYEKIHRWLSAPDPSSNHNEARKEWRATTGEWFIGSRQFTDWKSKPDSFLWLHGIPGCGKTVLCSTIIEDVLQHTHCNPAVALVYFYFDFNDIGKQRYENMIRSLITQLSTQGPSRSEALETLFSSCMNGIRQPTSSALLTTLQKMIQETDETFIILDALDECEERSRLLGIIEEMAGWGFKKSHVLVTSRREKDIEEVFEPLLNDKQMICCQSTLINSDIRIYVHERLQTDHSLKRWQNLPKVQEEIETALLSKADGM
jgi:NACHT domain